MAPELQTAFGHPASLVVDHFDCLRRTVGRIIRNKYEWKSRALPQDAAVAVMLAVPAFDVFLNSYCGLRAVEQGKTGEFFRECGKDRISIDRKLELWPSRYHDGYTVNLAYGPLKDFLDLKTVRNNLVHFWSKFDGTMDLGELKLEGLMDTSVYHLLDRHSAYHAYFTAENAVRAILSLQGKDGLGWGMMRWTGIHPHVPLENQYPWKDWQPDNFNRRDGEPQVTGI